MDQTRLLAISPVDGRYAAAADPLRALFSEAGLINERIRIEALWLLELARSVPQLTGAAMPSTAAARVAALARDPGAQAATAVKEVEARIKHDVKAVEYFVRQELALAGASPATLELVHFGCTSEDVNNLSYARLLAQARSQVLVPELTRLLHALRGFAREHARLPMLARTHGQTASPTTLGKEYANVAARLQRALARLVAVEILGKWNGAVGNFNAHHAALPGVDWRAISRQFVLSQNLRCNAYTTQIEPHDWIGEYADACAAINVILVDLCRDTWGYISLGYLRQRVVAGEVGSSTMPHKVNPIDFENAEGNLGIGNALFRHFAEKLPISRWQRDLSDSTVLRNVGVALAHTLIAWRAVQTGLAKLEPDATACTRDLEHSWEVLGEALQTVLRAHGVPNGYELVKNFARGAKIDAAALHAFVNSLPLPEAERARLAALRPAEYVGLAAELTLDATD
ncbi:MAG TPA: adenylosuccinate lyase [Steroidobacteraceae bacterium]|nr:adenylosuccinate lyase [Steroidobacteraceae bacterium]